MIRKTLYNKINNYSSGKKRKMAIVFEDKIADMFRNKNT